MGIIQKHHHLKRNKNKNHNDMYVSYLMFWNLMWAQNELLMNLIPSSWLFYGEPGLKRNINS